MIGTDCLLPRGERRDCFLPSLARGRRPRRPIPRLPENPRGVSARPHRDDATPYRASSARIHHPRHSGPTHSRAEILGTFRGARATTPPYGRGLLLAAACLPPAPSLACAQSRIEWWSRPAAGRWRCGWRLLTPRSLQEMGPEFLKAQQQPISSYPGVCLEECVRLFLSPEWVPISFAGAESLDGPHLLRPCCVAVLCGLPPPHAPPRGTAAVSLPRLQ